MSGDESEEKTLPPSQRKLDKQREKGSVVTSKEAVMSIVGISALIYLYAMRFSMSAKLAALWSLEPDYHGQSFILQLQSKTEIIWQLGLELVMPLMGIVIFVGVLTGMMVAGGPLFSVEPLMPNFDKINPASGFKKLFARKALMSFMMNVLRLTILLTVFILVLLGGWEALLLAPVCGLLCGLQTWDAVLLPMIIAAVAVMAAMAVFDYMVQRAEFMREQMMTMSEFKREMKDQMGDPHLRGHLKQERRAMMTTDTGPSKATLIVSAGRKVSVGIRYVEGETPAPLVVARLKTSDGIRGMVQKSGAYEHQDADLVKELSGIAVGDYIIKDELISQIAPLLQRAAAGG